MYKKTTKKSLTVTALILQKLVAPKLLTQPCSSQWLLGRIPGFYDKRTWTVFLYLMWMVLFRVNIWYFVDGEKKTGRNFERFYFLRAHFQILIDTSMSDRIAVLTHVKTHFVPRLFLWLRWLKMHIAIATHFDTHREYKCSRSHKTKRKTKLTFDDDLVVFSLSLFRLCCRRCCWSTSF